MASLCQLLQYMSLARIFGALLHEILQRTVSIDVNTNGISPSLAYQRKWISFDLSTLVPTEFFSVDVSPSLILCFLGSPKS